MTRNEMKQTLLSLASAAAKEEIAKSKLPANCYEKVVISVLLDALAAVYEHNQIEQQMRDTHETRNLH